MPNNNLPFGNINNYGIVTPTRKLSLNNGKVRVQGLTVANEKLINEYTKKYLNLGLPVNEAKRAARNDFEIKRSKNKSRKTRKQRKRYNS